MFSKLHQDAIWISEIKLISTAGSIGSISIHISLNAMINELLFQRIRVVVSNTNTHMMHASGVW